ncbi:MAG: DNA-binding protein WhiA [Clostridiales bacterium]|nr:DNA-binding protein WhiA [Clostridiales bacterium]
MSFAAGVKDDLTRVLSTKPCCRKAELAAFLRLCGNVRLSEGEASLSLRTENTAVARRIFLLVKECGLVTQLALERKARLKKRPAFSLRVPPQKNLVPFLNSLGLTGEAGCWQGFAEKPVAGLVKNDCCKRAYLRGAYLAAGYISRPEGAYHLEFDLPDTSLALFLQRLLAGFDLRAKAARRKGLMILYLKEAEQISLLLNIMGSHRSMLEFESLRVDKDLRNQVNRRVNCDNANVDKTVAASLKQIERLRLIEAGPGLNALKPALTETALLRLQHPEASLSELSDISGLGRSAINHRLRRLMEIADEAETRYTQKRGGGKSGVSHE